MKNRCLNPNQARYKDYGERGITVCRRWLRGEGDLSGFECFLADVGRRPSKRHSIERLRVNGNYTPSNVGWATRKTQARNTRANKIVLIKGQRLCLAEAVERFGAVSYSTALMRMWRSGWPAERAITTPPT